MQGAGLRGGTSTSCGCISGERASVRCTIDLTGQRFGRLTVVERAGTNADGKATWRCKCECGAEKVLPGRDMRNGRIRSCLCLRKEMLSERTRTHGDTGTTEYNSWASMIQRCTNEASENFADYGGRGIKVCDRWRSSFADFLADMGKKPSPGLTIERIDVNGHYEPGNCRWATVKEQCNNKRTTRYIEHAGQRLPLMAWSESLGMPRWVIQNRLRGGWSAEETLSTPVRPMKPRRRDAVGA